MIRKDLQFGKPKEAWLKVGLIYYLGVFRTLEGYTKKGYNPKKEVVARFFKTEKLAIEFRLHFFCQTVYYQRPNAVIFISLQSDQRQTLYQGRHIFTHTAWGGLMNWHSP